MEPLAIAGYVMVGSAAALAVMLGAIAGVVAWNIKGSLPWLALLAAGGYFADTVLWGSARLVPATFVGVPPLILTFLTAWLAAHYLAARARLRRPWATLAALGCALLLGFLWGFLFRLGLWTTFWIAVAADACLIVLFYRTLRRTRA